MMFRVWFDDRGTGPYTKVLLADTEQEMRAWVERAPGFLALQGPEGSPVPEIVMAAFRRRGIAEFEVG